MASSYPDFETSKKKRGTERQLTKDSAEDEGGEDSAEPGSFVKATEIVLAERRMVKVRRSGLSVASALGDATVNPFCVLPRLPTSGSSLPTPGGHNKCSLLASGETTNQNELGMKSQQEAVHIVHETPQVVEQMVEAVKGDVAVGIPEVSIVTSRENRGKHSEEVKGVPNLHGAAGTEFTLKDGEKADAGEQVETGEKSKLGNSTESELLEASPLKDVAASCVSGFAGLSSGANAFSSAYGASFSLSGAALMPSPAFGDFSFGGDSKFGKASSEGALPSLSSVFGDRSSGTLQLFGGTLGAVGAGCSASFGNPHPASAVCLSEVPVETGEEEESAVFSADATLYEFAEGATWKERGKGELRVNVPNLDGRRARLVMRAKGNYRLLLNAYLFPDMKLTRMDGRGVTFACMNSSGAMTAQVLTCALKFKDSSIVDGFANAVERQKGREGMKHKAKIVLGETESGEKS